MRPRPVGNRCARQIDDRVQRLFAEFFEAGNCAHLFTTDFRDLLRAATPYRQVVALPKPVSAELTSYQTSTAGQQYVHDIFLAWRFTRIPSLFLKEGIFVVGQALCLNNRPSCQNENAGSYTKKQNCTGFIHGVVCTER
jgi:hypothetical protein